MTSIGQLTGRAFVALWRRRFAVLGLMLAWLALDGVLLGLLSTYYPALGLTLPRRILNAIDPAWLRSDWFQILLLLPLRYVGDAIRAVFVVLLLRTLLAPPAGAGEQAKLGLIVPVLLIWVFEMAWTTVLFPIDHGFTLAVARATTDGTADAATLGWFSALVRGLIFACFALVMSKLCFVYPNATLRNALRPGRSWRDTDGLAARLFLLFVAIPIPFFMLHSVLTMVVFRYDAILESHHYVSLAFLILNSVREVPVVIATLTVIAVAYVAATGHRAAAIPGAGRTPGQLAEAFD